MHDFVVVGAGPAGARFARQAAAAGHDVVVFEQGEIGEPLACSGHVSLDIWEYVPDGARDALHQNSISGARFHPGGPDTGFHRFYKDEPVSNAIDRVRLDQVLAEAAGAAGADVRDGHTVTAVREYPRKVVVEATGESDVELESRMVVGCDGPRSRVRSELGLPEPTELLHGVLGFEPEPDHENFVDVHLDVPGFFSWRIPRGDAGVEYGLAMPPGGDVSQRFDELVASYGATIDRRCSGAIPIGPAYTVTSHRGFLLGDAAAQTKPFTGGGILYGMTAADIAAETVDPLAPDTLTAYEHAWRSELRRDQRLGALVRRAYGLPTPVQRFGMWLFAGKIGVHMDRPSSLFSLEQLKAFFTR